MRIDWIRVGLALFFILVAIYIVAPLIIIVVNSFNSVAYSVFPPEGFSFQWYEHLLTRPEFGKGFRNSMIVGVISSIIAVAVALLAALAFVRYRFRGADILRSFFLSPVVVPKIVLGLSLFILFLRLGIFGNLYSLIMAHVVVTMPFALAVLVGTISALDPELEEAAQDLGANNWQAILHIILPQTRVGLAISAIFAFIISFDQIDTTLFLVRPAINTLPVEMFLYMERWQDPSMAALSTLLILFALVMLLLARPLVGGITDVWSRR